MPEIKHNFTDGKMNKDLDERLVPNGQHRDAMNVQISNSDGSDVGTVQNVLGNFRLQANLPYHSPRHFLSNAAMCIASIADEKNDCVYWFVKDTNADFILKYKKATESNKNEIIPVLVDKYKNCLKFPDTKITGINIIDNLLFWTDGVNEPKKINIDRCIEGTRKNQLLNNLEHTHLVVKGQEIRNITEKDITIIKKAPKIPLNLELKFFRDPQFSHSGIIITSESPTIPHSFLNSSIGSQIHSFSGISIGDRFQTVIDTDINGSNNFTLNWKEGDSVVLKEFDSAEAAPIIPIYNYAIKGFITDWQWNNFSNEVLDITMRTAYHRNSVNDTNSSGGQDSGWIRGGTHTHDVEDLLDSSNVSIDEFGDGGMYNSDGVTLLRVNERSDGSSIGNTEFRAIGVGDSKKAYVRTTTSNTADPFYDRSQPVVFGDQYILRYTIRKTYNKNLEGRLVVRLFDGHNDFPRYITIAEHGTGKPGSYDKVDGTTVSKTNKGPIVAGSYEILLNDWNEYNVFGGTSGTGLSNNYYKNSLLFEIKREWDDINQTYSGGKYLHCDITDIQIIKADNSQAKVEIEVTSIDGTPATPQDGDLTLKYAIDSFVDEDGLFEKKLPRFSYRYKYQDGEYSTFAPFTNVAFTPGVFNYEPSKGYNMGMSNTIKEVLIKDINKNKPDDVIEIDILYKEEGSTVVYVVDTLKEGVDEYLIDGETINGIVPANQSLRLWDNVPKSAKAQEVVGNRVTYGNYVQNYDLINSQTLEDYGINLQTTITSKAHTSREGIPSIKSLREYQIGVVYTDKYGRETPVLTNSNSTFRINKDAADNLNEIVVKVETEGHPLNMDYFKFYVKDTGGVYYNLAMDRYYDAEDGNAWLAFPSVERNKIDIDDYLILKKGQGPDSLIKTQAKYKVVDIQNEAPEHIKKVTSLLASKRHSDANPIVYDQNIPIPGLDTIQLDDSRFSGAMQSFVDLFGGRPSAPNGPSNVQIKPGTEYFIEFSNATTNQVSKRYKIENVQGVSYAWEFQIESKWGDEVGDFCNNPDGHGVVSDFVENVYVNIYKVAIVNSPKFDGRFFVKIYKDQDFGTILSESIDELQFQYSPITNASKDIYYCEDNGGGIIENHGVSGVNDCWTGFEAVAYDDFILGQTSTAAGLQNTLTSGKQPTLKMYLNSWAHVTYAVGDFSYGYVDASLFPIDWDNTTGTVDYNFGGMAQKFIINALGWKAYLRGLNTEVDQKYTVGDSSAVYGRVKEIDMVEDNENGKFEDVWFINNTVSTFKKTMTYRHPNTFGLSVSATSPGTCGGENYTTGYYTPPAQAHPWRPSTVGGWKDYASSDKSHLEISFGGIEPNAWPTDASSTGWPYHDFSFFDLSETNNNYNSTQGDFIKKLAAGSQFRFKQDPTATIYTIEDVDMYQRIMYDNINEWENENPQNNFNHYKNQVKCRTGVNSGHQNWITRNDVNGEPCSFRVSPFLDAANFTVSYKLKLNKAIVWNPVLSPGTEIPNGIKITLSATTSAPTPSDGLTGEMTITTQSITGIDSFDGKEKLLQVGMVLHTYGSTSLTKLAVIEKITFDDPNYTIYFRAYSGQFENLDTANSSGNIPNIGAGDDLHFSQYCMNGLSPNSAKNLNFFRNAFPKGTNSGNSATGYTMEFVELSSIDPEGDVVSRNPAVWETEPKENADLEIYYEASEAFPITTDTSLLQDFIPPGSVVEHISSGGISKNTTVESIDNNGVMKLSRPVEIIITAPLPTVEVEDDGLIDDSVDVS